MPTLKEKFNEQKPTYDDNRNGLSIEKYEQYIQNLRSLRSKAEDEKSFLKEEFALIPMLTESQKNLMFFQERQDINFQLYLDTNQLVDDTVKANGSTLYYHSSACLSLINGMER